MVIAAGHWTKEVCEKMGMGDPEAQSQYLRRAIPIGCRKRYTYIINAKQSAPVFDMPYIIDEDSKLTIRRHGLKGDYIVTMWPDENNVEYKGGWAGNVDVNTFDGGPIVGKHPYHRNVSIISGFGGLGAHLSLGGCMWMARYWHQFNV